MGVRAVLGDGDLEACFHVRSPEEGQGIIVHHSMTFDTLKIQLPLPRLRMVGPFMYIPLPDEGGYKAEQRMPWVDQSS